VACHQDALCLFDQGAASEGSLQAVVFGEALQGDVDGALQLAGPTQQPTDYLPSGFKHLLVTFADPFLVESWAGLTIDGLPSLDEQIRLFHSSVMPAFG
jgi:hypothetical protein